MKVNDKEPRARQNIFHSLEKGSINRKIFQSGFIVPIDKRLHSQIIYAQASLNIWAGL
jgi:hypothetical protein